jgi:aminoglycoside phosphotransferase (APT) family kinase protein
MVPEAPLHAFARDVVVAALGSECRVAGVQVMQGGLERAVLLVTLRNSPRRLVLKVADRSAGTGVDFARTSIVADLARRAGAPVAAVIAVDVSSQIGPWAYLLQEHVDGTLWRDLRPLLDGEQLRASHRQLAEAVLAVQSVRFHAFGELGASGEAAGVGLVDALRHRAELRIPDGPTRARFLAVLKQEAASFAGAGAQAGATLGHDDLHHSNVVFRPSRNGWRLAALLDWDKAWAAPPESDIARMAFWDNMTGPGFWEVYRAAVPASEGADKRALIYQLLWCLEYVNRSPRHLADTAALWERLGNERASGDG